ncbi:MAG: acyl-CoA reductase, partial [Candidatus Binataceae bacterium]
ARWRALAQRPDDYDFALWEGGRIDPSSADARGDTMTAPISESMTNRVIDSMTWTVIYDGAATFCASPGYRTVFVSALESADELGRRLGAAAGRLEAFALATPPDVRAGLDAGLRQFRVSYVCEPGRMQSPPLDWPHGGGAMLELLQRAAR